MVKINVDVPKQMMEIAQNAEAANKAYDICLHCPFMSESCDGPNILAMDYYRWVEWANAMAKRRGLTRSTIAENANLSKGTVDSALSGKNKDVRSATMRDITKAIVGGCWGQYPCHFASQLMAGDLAEDDMRADELQKELDKTRSELDALKEQNKSSVSSVKEEDQRKVDFLKEQISFKDAQILRQDKTISRKDKVIAALGIALGILAAFVIVVLAYDVISPNVGWFRY